MFATGTGVDRCLQIKETGQHARAVCFDDRDRLVESESRYGIGCVTSHAGQLADGIGRCRETASMLLHDRERRGPQISGARIIAESLPGMQNIVLGSGGERFDGREAPQPFVIVRDDRIDLSLLKHEFGNKDRVGIICSAPGKIAAIFAVPGKKRAAEGRIRFDKENVQRLPAPKQ